VQHQIKIRRIYEKSLSRGGTRFLVDRLWPRGVRKEAIRAAGWVREVAPSQKLRNWFGHNPKRWAKFRKLYVELAAKREIWMPILKAAAKGNVILLFSAHDLEHNNAVALQKFLQRRLRKRQKRRSSVPTSRMKQERKTQK
jgi:uncharacterized protein YeaO (DUF488 family)